MICQKFTAKTGGEKLWKILQHLAKLEARSEWHLFSDTVYLLLMLLLHFNSIDPAYNGYG